MNHIIESCLLIKLADIGFLQQHFTFLRQQLLLPAEMDEELSETAATRHSKDGGQQLHHQQD